MVILKIGILDLQGDVKEHYQAIKKCGAESYLIKYKEDLKKIDGLIIPGGESTTIGKLLLKYGLVEEIKKSSLPIFGTCAGVVLMAKKIKDSEQVRLSLMDIEVERNVFGRQKFSFEEVIKIEKLGINNYRGIFIRSPIIKEVGEKVEVLAKLGDKIVFVKEGNRVACSFHPELTDDIRIHQYFLNIVKEAKN